MAQVLIRIVASHGVFPLIATDGVVNTTSPFLKYMKGWSHEEVFACVKKRGWEAEMTKDNAVIVFTDGSCFPNPNGPGGWAFVARYKETKVEHYGSEKRATNNRMELMGVLRAMQRVKPSRKPLIIVTDSQYALNCVTKWINWWRGKGNWQTSEGKPVQNKDILEAIHEVKSRHVNLELVWVRGHVGNVDNERADVLASEARKGQKSNWDTVYEKV